MLKNHLTKRPGSKSWQLRLPVPRKVQSIVGRAEVTRSLKTEDRAQAEERAMELILEFRKGWERLSRGDELTGPLQADAQVQSSVPDERDLEDAAHLAGYDLLTNSREKQRKEQATAGPEAWAKHKDAAKADYLRWEQRFAADDLMRLRPIADRLIEKQNWLLDPQSEQYGRFLKMIAENYLDGLKLGLARDSRHPDPEPAGRSTRAAIVRKSGAKDGSDTIMALYERYAEFRRMEGKRADTIREDRKIIELFSEFVGAGRSVASITPVEARDFRDTLLALPQRYKGRNDYKGLGVREAARVARERGDKPISQVTVSKYLSTVSPFFSWLLRDLHVAANPFKGLHLKPVRNQSSRPPFSIEQLNRLVESPLFTGFEGDGKEHLSGNCRVRDWRFWIPVLCLFTGARISEVSQLRRDDFHQQDEWWFVTFREDRKRNQQTKNHKSRAVAIHPMLQRIGLVAFVSSITDAADAQLFPEIQANARGHAGASPSRFFRKYLGKIGLKDGADGFGSHSFRHFLADQLRMAGYLDAEFGPLILGHSNASHGVTAGYGKLPQGTARRLVEMIEAVRFEGVRFDHLIQEGS